MVSLYHNHIPHPYSHIVSELSGPLWVQGLIYIYVITIAVFYAIACFIGQCYNETRFQPGLFTLR